MNAQRGLSVLTVIVIIIILLVLTALAIPTWHAHHVRKHLDEALKAAEEAKLVVMEAATIHGGLNHINANEIGYSPATTTDPYVAHIGIADDGRITLATRNTGAAKDPVLQLTPSESKRDRSTSPITWSCTMTIGDPSVAPAGCRVGHAADTSVAEPARATTTRSALPAGSS